MGMDHRRAAKVLGKELEAQGYTYHLDDTHSHPRLYIHSQGEQRFTIMTTTQDYDEGNLLAMKRQDIVRDVLPHLPKPKYPKANNTIKVKDNKVFEIAPCRVYEVKLFIGGKGTLVFSLPKDAIPSGKQCAIPQLFGDKFGIIFCESGKDATIASPTRSEEKMCYHFARSKIDFEYATKQPANYKPPLLCARLKGDSLVCDQPIPQPLLEDSAPTENGPKITKKTKERYNLSDGGDLRVMINEWADWARNKGHEPVMKVDNKGKLSISVTTKIVREL